MDATQALQHLRRDGKLGVRADNRDCFMTSANVIECDAADAPADADAVVHFSPTEFIAEFNGSTFHKLNAEDYA